MPSKAPGVLGKRISRQNDLDGAWMEHTETGRNEVVAAGASARQPRQEGEQRPGGAPPALPPACPGSCPTAAPSCPAAPGPEPSAARLGVSTVAARVRVAGRGP